MDEEEEKGRTDIEKKKYWQYCQPTIASRRYL